MNSMNLFFIIFTFHLPFDLAFTIRSTNNKVNLFDIKALVFLKNEKVQTKQSSAPGLQLQCVGGSFGCSLTPDKVECYNRGEIGQKIQWDCKADLPKTAKISQVDIVCEGFDSQNDPFVLDGSCGLKYSLDGVETKQESSKNLQQPAGQFYNKVKLSDISALTLKKNSQTNYRRTSPIPQLQCIPIGNGGCSFEPDIVQCQNKGFDGISQQWECKANLPQGLKFGETKISCEGFESSTDTYHLAGSCGLKYSLNRDSSYVPSYSTGKTNSESKSGSSLKSALGTILGVTIGGLILLACCIIIPICCCLKCLCFKDCGSSGGGPKRSDYAYQQTPVMQPAVVYHPQNPMPQYYPAYNNNGGNPESSAFATTETR